MLLQESFEDNVLKEIIKAITNKNFKDKVSVHELSETIISPNQLVHRLQVPCKGILS